MAAINHKHTYQREKGGHIRPLISGAVRPLPAFLVARTREICHIYSNNGKLFCTLHSRSRTGVMANIIGKIFFVLIWQSILVNCLHCFGV